MFVTPMIATIAKTARRGHRRFRSDAATAARARASPLPSR